MSKKFIKKIEDFICDNCGALVHGDGYTNHCPECLWSKHVDVYPGDRDAKCGGLMEPVEVEYSGGEYTLTHRCQKCGTEKKNKASEKDNTDMLIELSSRM